MFHRYSLQSGSSEYEVGWISKAKNFKFSALAQMLVVGLNSYARLKEFPKTKRASTMVEALGEVKEAQFSNPQRCNVSIIPLNSVDN